jgi:hypothetical protein
MKIEVGKKYKCESKIVKYFDVIDHKPELGNCCFITIVYFNDGRASHIELFREDGESAQYQITEEYTEPKEFERYFNVYEKKDIFWHESKQSADKCNSEDVYGKRIACQRVVFKENTWDE